MCFWLRDGVCGSASFRPFELTGNYDSANMVTTGTAVRQPSSSFYPYAPMFFTPFYSPPFFKHERVMYTTHIYPWAQSKPRATSTRASTSSDAIKNTNDSRNAKKKTKRIITIVTTTTIIITHQAQIINVPQECLHVTSYGNPPGLETFPPYSLRGPHCPCFFPTLSAEVSYTLPLYSRLAARVLTRAPLS